MNIWQDFENQCCNYLNEQFGEYANFELMGGSDSTISDIKVNTFRGKEFFIEAKHSPAQCGQFVLLPNLKTKTFDYSCRNITPLNKYSKEIIEFMNQDFESFKEAGTSGKLIEIQNSSEIFGNWIIETYKRKNAPFIISNGNQILPLEDIVDCFSITAKYRVKRSGSSKVGNKYLNIVKTFIANNYSIDSSRENDGGLFVNVSQNFHNKRFIVDGNEYMFALREGLYEIRRLSNTFNANVIFSIELKPRIYGLTKEEFITYLKY